MPAPSSSPRMVGRHTELAALLEAYDDGVRAVPRTVIVRGEAGVGKTRLVQEFLALVTADPLGSRSDPDDEPVVAFGQCVDLGPIGAAFGPVRRVLRDLHAAVGTDALREAAGSAAAIASLAALVPGIADETPEAEEATGEFAEAIEVLLERLSQRRHVIVVLEDLQWADAATMALLKTLASTLRGRRLTIVATYRSDDIDRFHPLRPVLAELDRTRSVVRVEVTPLNPDEVAEQVAQLAGGLDPRVVEALAERSGGIPFLVEELVDLGDRALPDTLRELVLARYARLGEDAQQALRTMAAGGVHVDDDVLAAVTALDEHALDHAVREAIDTRVIVADGAGYAFRHALTREAVEGEMLPSERVRVHRRYAEHLRDHRGESPDDASAVAEHWLAARDLPAAFDATVVALQETRSRFSPATAAKLAERLAELWDQVPDAETRSGTTLPALHLDAAQAWHDLGDPERALRSANEGLAVCPDDPITRAALLRRRYVETFNLEHRGRRDDIDEAVSLLEGSDDRRARILLSRVLTNMAIDEHGTDAAQHAARAIALAEESGDDDALAVALTVEAWRIAGDEDDEPGALAPLERAVTLRLDPSMRAYAGQALTDMLLRVGRFDEASVVGAQHFEEVSRAGIERGSGAALAHSLSFALFATGRPDAGLRYAQRARRLLSPVDSASVVRRLASHLSWDDRAAERDDLFATERGRIEESQRRYPDKDDWWAIERAEAALALHGGEIGPVATDVLAAAEGEARTPAVRRYALLTAALLTLAPGRTPDPDARARIGAAVETLPGVGLARSVAGFVRASLADADGVPAAQRVEAWRGVVDDLSGGGMPIWHVQTAHCRLAWALIDAGERTEAATLLSDVAAESPALGVARVARWATELATQARLAPGSATADSSHGAVATLTPRELQVLELIAEGLTNPQIGQRLFISPKTASVHVSAILAKIGAANRAEAAALYAASASTPTSA
ncbi:DNA-binding CsgD family transcriptional regulator/tetratricopeptide (TPR) repeat protein [Microbacterium sp. BE35]|uniref:helix-turn-helix transcriptional regulator n=1 Tax=Microbacterium sp. BE35 TaxID=2817773 RepID=UPI002857EFFF|nr:AAA family ATPase [Microbacterium sp. BE35]MDR7188911.1 DNA-binding CsgD family transcriptional regulator/tetratricopeptide (TPR) repeat protein [Microbacterium sp. BE35]